MPEIVIYAAGLGSRLGMNIPKALLQLNNKMLIDYQLDAIEKVFPDAPVHIMTGYQYEKWDLLKGHFSRRNNPVYIHRNPFYEFGIMGTAWLSLREVQSDDIIRIDGDVYFTEETLLTLAKAEESSLLVSKVTTEKTTVEAIYADADMFEKIVIRKNYIGDNEWICIERYFNNDYRDLVTEGINYLPLSAYYFESINRYYQHDIHKMKILSNQSRIRN